MNKLTIETAAALATMLDRNGLNAVVTELCELETKRRVRDDEQSTQKYDDLSLVGLLSAMPGFATTPLTFSVTDQCRNRDSAEQFSAWGGFINRGDSGGPGDVKYVTFDLRLNRTRLVKLKKETY